MGKIKTSFIIKPMLCRVGFFGPLGFSVPHPKKSSECFKKFVARKNKAPGF